ncbi:ricin-type beta-trefoil lectin domain protein [Streptomyces sp. NPDC048340]|uniref:ricin-type beta-trefoil lectin domain protein n=1 Tax=Streptomyces sp. NPDC048340 TaxID=3365537 RepID=UPI0037151CFF
MSANGSTALKGSRATETWTDVLNRTSEVRHFTATDLTTWNKTTYSYDVRGKLSKVTDPAGNNWTYAYDARGRMTSSDDPDMGKSTFTYNSLDQQVSATDSAGRAQYTAYDVLGRKTAVRDNAADGPLVSSWTYDTLPGAKGLAVASTRYEGGAAYTSEVTGYDTESRPTGSKITIPDVAATKGFAGTYAYGTTYTPRGKVQSTTLPATPGGLAAEKLITRYDDDGLPKTLSGLNWYTADTVYSPFGEVLRTASGNHPNRVWTTNLYDQYTGRVTESTSDRETANPNRISSLSYAYDAVGNPTSITDTQAGGRIDRQCFTYDAMGQLTNAWTGKTAACTGPSLSDVTPGPDGDGYWQEYQFDKIGNRTQLIDHDLTNGALDDKTTYDYGVTVTGNGTQPASTTQPHALAKTTKTTNTPGRTVTSLSNYEYDASGNTKSRRIDGDTQALNWDRRNKLTSATSPGIGSVTVIGVLGKCLDVAEGSTADGTAAQIWPCNETKAQQWRLTGDTVRAFEKCLTTSGTKVLIATCDGSDKQKFLYRASDKSLYNPAANQCVDVPNNAIDGSDLQLWSCNATGAQQWNFDNTTTYVYGPSGERLIQETGSARTLYLGEAEITVNKAGQAIDAVRYYSSPGAPTTVRRTEGKSQNHKLSVLLTDHHNTATASVDQSPGQATTRRKSDPYGNPRGALTSNWPDDHTFLGTGVDDNTTALTHIGAREYEASTGRFISVDPVIDITDPLQMNGYTYAAGNPISGSDPSGLRSDECGTLYKCTGQSVITFSNAKETTAEYTSLETQRLYYETHAPAPDFHGGGNATDEAWTYTRIAKQILSNVNVPYVTGLDFKPGHFLAGMGQGVIDLASSGHPLTLLSKWVFGPGGPSVGDVSRNLLNKAGINTNDNYFEIGEILSPVPGGAAAKVGEKFLARFSSKCNSFTPETPVLMADGTTKPHADVVPGDKVLATDPESGKTTAEDVTATIDGEGTKKLVQIAVAQADTADGSTTAITATDKHPFWVPALGEWVNATDLTVGESLQTSAGSLVQITAINRWTQQASVRNLTVANIHTYYVLAGATPILVHNADAGCANKLRNALNAAGDVEPATPHSPHHIVAGNSPKAASARAQLDKFGIGVNDAENGVWLPRSSSSPNPHGLSVHSKIHTNEYYTYVNDLMSGARNMSEALDVIGHVRRQLQGGHWP